MGPGLAALAVGGGITAYHGARHGGYARRAHHRLPGPGSGAAPGLPVQPPRHPRCSHLPAHRGLGAAVDTAWAPGWTLVGILDLWSALEVGRTSQGRGAPTRSGRRRPGPAGERATHPRRRRKPVAAAPAPQSGSRAKAESTTTVRARFPRHARTRARRAGGGLVAAPSASAAGCRHRYRLQLAAPKLRPD